MKVFTASNGILFTIAEDGVLRWEGGYDHHRVTAALREYFQAERDEELGRWRDPENPNEVVYPEDYGITVVDERNLSRFWWSRLLVALPEAEEGRGGHATARAYYAAHPEPKPWDAAQPDEVWALTINNDTEEVFRCGERGLYSLKTGNPIGSLLSCGSNKITAGRRIWPEGEAS